MDDSTRQATRLWTLAQPRVSAFVSSIVHNFRDRDDVLQDIAVAAVESFDSYDSNRPFSAWVMGVARNQIGLYLRKHKRERQVFGESTMDSIEAAFASIEEPPRQLDHLNECINKLDERSRGLCKLRYEQDLKPAAIGDLVGMSANAVAKAMQRIRDSLRLCIERKAAGGEPA